MKIDRHIFRKVLWAPTAALSVSMTLYLANLWISQNNLKPLNSLLKEEPQVESQETIPKAEEGEDKPEKEEEKSEPTKKEEQQKPKEKENKQEASPQQPPKQEEPAPTPPPPPPVPASTTVSNQSEGEGESSTDTEESQTIPASTGNTDLEKYIIAKIQDLNLHGLEWNKKCSDELLASWKISSTTQSLLQAIQEFVKNNEDKGPEESSGETT